MKKILAIVRNETFKSFVHTFVSDLLYDTVVGGVFTHIITNGDFSKTSLYTLGYAVFRTFLRVLREYLIKKYPKDDKNL